MSLQYPTAPLAILRSIARNRELLWDLIKRDFIGRYKGSVMGIAWSLLNPLFMLAIYTFVFSVAFKARWGAETESKVTFAIVLFSGLVVHALFAECLNRSPTLITSHTSYVKKVVFPLEILPLMAIGSALGHFLVSLAVLLAFCLLVGWNVHLAGLLIPIILLPLLLIILGLSWLLASLGVYLRDFAQVIGMATTVTLFLAPVFYPIEALPPLFQNLLFWNPITLPVIQLRGALLWGAAPDWGIWSFSLAIATFILCLGFAWFQKTRKGFADVL